VRIQFASKAPQNFGPLLLVVLFDRLNSPFHLSIYCQRPRLYIRVTTLGNLERTKMRQLDMRLSSSCCLLAHRILHECTNIHSSRVVYTLHAAVVTFVAPGQAWAASQKVCSCKVVVKSWQIHLIFIRVSKMPCTSECDNFLSGLLRLFIVVNVW
jgi:hypothetical protein